MTGSENFLSRWSRLKREPEPEPVVDAAVEAEQVVDVPAHEQVAAIDAGVDEHGIAGDAASDAPGEEAEPHPAELIDIDQLTNESDFSSFVSRGVPAALQRKALRKLWTLDPVYANLDGLNDYENIIEDFGISELKPGGTAWKIGRGFQTDEDFARVKERGGYKTPEEKLAEAEKAAEEERLAAEQAEADADTDTDGETGPEDDTELAASDEADGEDRGDAADAKSDTGQPDTEQGQKASRKSVADAVDEFDVGDDEDGLA